MTDLGPFPQLVEGERLDPDQINGVDPARLTIGAEGDAVITFRDEVARFENVLGVYLIDQDGTIRDPQIVFARIEHADPLPGLPSVRPGGGPLSPGDAVHLNALYPAADLEPGQQFGLFTVANGAERNPSSVFDGSGRLEFVDTSTGGPANIADDAVDIELRHFADDGSVRMVQGPVFHTADNDPDPLRNDLNPGGAERVVSGLDPTSGALVLGFEDLRDFDFNDVVIDLGAPVVVPPPIVTPPASLADLDGTNGFRLDGVDVYDGSGRSVASAGDVNGDGFADVIVGAPFAEPGGADHAGESYVVFGKTSGFAASIDLATLDGANGFRLPGIDDGDFSGDSVASAGDVNGDGFADVIIGAYGAYAAGASYVVFGMAGGFGASLDLASLDGTNGLRLDGIDPNDLSGYSVASAGDVDGDGFADLIIGAREAYDGESYVVFGKASGFAASLDLATLDGTNGSLLRIGAYASFIEPVASAGDVNGDGFADLLIGAPYEGEPIFSGQSYVVFGTASGFGDTFDLPSLNGSNGFSVNGIGFYHFSGYSVASAGDVNGDGFADLITGARGAEPSGESYVVFGRGSGFAASLDVAALDGSNGIRLEGGYSVASAGDVNGDGFDDIIIGARFADSNAGVSYVVFGKGGGFDASLDLASLDETSGFRLGGIDAVDLSGSSVASAGDINGDGFDDVIIGAPGADVGEYGNDDGESYVVFGGNFTGAVSQLGGAGNDTLTGTAGNDVLLGAQGDDTLLGNGGIDVLNGGEGDDLLALLDPAFLEGFGAGGGRVLGGTGIDTLRLDGAGVSLDLTAIPEPRLQGIEQVDLGGDGKHARAERARDPQPSG